MKRKLPTILILVVMALLGAMYWVDMCYYTDPNTGFIIRGNLWSRYIVLLLPLVMGLLGLRTVGPKAIAVLRVRSKKLSLLYLIAAVVGIAFGITRIVYSVRPLLPYELSLGILFIWYGVWMFFACLQLFVQAAPTPTSGALPGVFAALPFCMLAVYRVMIRPSTIFRMAPLVAAFSALLAMLWFSTLLHSLYIALTQWRARVMYMLGIFTFLFCTCLELNYAVHTALFGTQNPLDFLESLNVGMLGIIAGCTSVSIAGLEDKDQL